MRPLGVVSHTSTRRVGAAAAALTVIIEDSFTTGVDMGGRAPDVTNTPGNTWIEAKRNWACVGGSVAMAEAGDGTCIIDAEVGNHTVSADFVRTNAVGDQYGVLVNRAIDGASGNTWMGLLFGSGLYLYATGIGLLTADLLGSGPVLDQWYNLKIVSLEDNFKAYLDGVLKADFTMSGGQFASWPASRTFVGINSGDTDKVRFDNFKVSV